MEELRNIYPVLKDIWEEAEKNLDSLSTEQANLIIYLLQKAYDRGCASK